MHKNTAWKILSDDNELDIAKLAEAHSNSKPEKRTPSVKRSLDAWSKIKTKEKNDEAWRHKVRKAWDKKKPS